MNMEAVNSDGISALYQMPHLSKQLSRWQKLFKRTGFTCDMTQIHLPQIQPGWRLIVIPQGLTLSPLVDAMRGLFHVQTYTNDLDHALAVNDRCNQKSSYAILVRDRAVADSEHKNKSALQITQQKVAGITVLERLLLEFMYYIETGRHLDPHTFTLCSGSRTVDGDVIHIDWNSGYHSLCIHKHPSDWADSLTRTREVVYCHSE